MVVSSSNFVVPHDRHDGRNKNETTTKKRRRPLRLAREHHLVAINGTAARPTTASVFFCCPTFSPRFIDLEGFVALFRSLHAFTYFSESLSSFQLQLAPNLSCVALRLQNEPTTAAGLMFRDRTLAIQPPPYLQSNLVKSLSDF